MMKESTTSPGSCVQVRVMVVVPGEADGLVGEEGMMAITLWNVVHSVITD
jgi:hypothetical protein